MRGSSLKTSYPMNTNKILQSRAVKSIRKNWELYLILLPVVLYFIIFQYWPMYGVQIAFRNFQATLGITGSPWVGIRHFTRLFNSYYFNRLIINTLAISVYQLVVGFPIPILLALMMNEVKNNKFKKAVQLVTYAPHFLSIVVVVGMMNLFLSPQHGIVNEIIKLFGGEAVFFIARPEWFRSLYVWSGVWQNTGWESIIYMAAIVGIDPELYEASVVDGAGKFQRIWNITIPCLLPTAIILFILNTGRIMSVGFEKVFLMQNNLNKDVSDVISTYIYQNGVLGAQYSFSAAVGLFNSVINFALLLIVNAISGRVSKTSLW